MSKQMGKHQPETINLEIERLIPDDINANRGTVRGAAALEESLRKYGAARSILIDRNGKVIAGNKTLERAKALGFKDVLVVRTDGRKIVAVKRTDLDMNEGMKARELAIADNRVGELSLDWDPEALAKLESIGVDLEKWFTEKELEQILGSAPGEGKEKSSVEDLLDRAMELQKKWGTDVGQIWETESGHRPGEFHRLMVGDSTDPDQVARLFAGKTATLMPTDPPYGVAYSGRGKSTSQQTIANDDLDLVTLGNFLTATFTAWDRFLAPGSPVYICHADGKGIRPVFEAAMRRAQWHVDQMLAWVKQSAGMGWMDFRWQHEPILYGWTAGAAPYFCGDPNLSTVWEISRDAVGDYDHPTQKPVDLFVRMQQYSSRPGDIIAEPFSGSGSNFMAAELIGRICYAMELAPKYAAVALERMKQEGLDPRQTQ
jgi:hypothetical protein